MPEVTNSQKSLESAVEEESCPQHKQLVANCRAAFLARMQASLNDIQELCHNTEARKMQLRHNNSLRADERMKLLQEEADRVATRQEDIDRRWEHLLHISTSKPDELPEADVTEHIDESKALVTLYEDLIIQRKACTVMLENKDGFIEEAQTRLTKQDEEYVEALTRYGQEIENLLVKIQEDSKSLRDKYELEINQLEKKMLEKREIALQEHNNIIDGLLAERNAAELRHYQKAQEREQNFQREMESLRVQNGHVHHQLQIQLETERNAANLQLESGKAATQVQHEKLIHDHRLLMARQAEKMASLTEQKKKLTKLRDAVMEMTTKYQEHDGREKKRHEELTNELHRLQKQYKDLQHRFQHFELADRDRYDKAWAQHESEIQAAAEKVVAIDELLLGHWLGLEWTPPPRHGLLQILEKEKEHTADRVSRLNGLNAGDDGLVKVVGDREGQGNQDISVENSIESSNYDHDRDDSQERDTALVMEQILLSRMTTLITEEAGFLLIEDTAAVEAQRQKAILDADKKSQKGKDFKRNQGSETFKKKSDIPIQERDTKYSGATEKRKKAHNLKQIKEGNKEGTNENSPSLDPERTKIHAAMPTTMKLEPKTDEQAPGEAEEDLISDETMDPAGENILDTSQCVRERVLDALGVQDESEARLLLTYFLKKREPRGPKATSSTESVETDVPLEDVDNGAIIEKVALLLPAVFAESPTAYTMIGPEDVVPALQRFVIDKRMREETIRKQLLEQRKRQRCRQSLSGVEGIEKKGQRLWESMANILPAENFRIWQDLEQALLQYHRLLEERSRIIQNLGGLEEENSRLRGAVWACMEDRVNAELLVPPFAAKGDDSGVITEV